MANIRSYTRDRADSNISRIEVDRDLCIAAVSCIAVAETALRLDDENKVIVTDANAVDDETLRMAAESCPTKAILLYDKSGTRIFPK